MLATVLLLPIEFGVELQLRESLLHSSVVLVLHGTADLVLDESGLLMSTLRRVTVIADLDGVLMAILEEGRSMGLPGLHIVRSSPRAEVLYGLHHFDIVFDACQLLFEKALLLANRLDFKTIIEHGVQFLGAASAIRTSFFHRVHSLLSFKPLFLVSDRREWRGLDPLTVPDLVRLNASPLRVRIICHVSLTIGSKSHIDCVDDD